MAFLLCFLTSSYFLSIKEPGIQTPTSWLCWDISLPSSWSAGFLNKVVFLAATPHLSDSLAYRVVSRANLDSVTCSDRRKEERWFRMWGHLPAFLRSRCDQCSVEQLSTHWTRRGSNFSEEWWWRQFLGGQNLPNQRMSEIWKVPWGTCCPQFVNETDT